MTIIFEWRENVIKKRCLKQYILVWNSVESILVLKKKGVLSDIESSGDRIVILANPAI